MQAEGKVVELILLDGLPAARILCPPRLMPAPGAYLLAHADASDSPLAVPLFLTKSFPDTSASAGGFLCAPPAPASWIPGTRLLLRGPLGRGFSLPASARRMALITFDDMPRRLLALLDLAFKQNSEVTLLCGDSPDDLPLQVEVQPLRALTEVCQWADYLACDVGRESLPELREKLGKAGPLGVLPEAQVLVRAPMPCGGLAECGVCTVETRGGNQLACVDGPVFGLGNLLREL